MPVRSVKNQYLGINAHLHSLWQAEGGWPEFHSGYILNLFYALKPLLLPLGYTAAIESALQIRYVDFPGETEYPESDLTIFDLDPTRSQMASGYKPIASVGELVLPIAELLHVPVSEKPYNAIKIYDRRSSRGTPVVWIEVLSPSNKTVGRDGSDYLKKRDKIIESGIVFIELDYLHETPPTVRRLPNYQTQLADTPIQPHPYYILVIDPRPSMEQGLGHIIGFDVDSPIPTVKISLNGNDTLEFDFGKPYHKTIEDALYGLEWVDYAQLPNHFDRYREADQSRIAARMLSVLKAYQTGHDLETGPFSPESLSLAEALRQIEAFG